MAQVKMMAGIESISGKLGNYCFRTMKGTGKVYMHQLPSKGERLLANVKKSHPKFAWVGFFLYLCSGNDHENRFTMSCLQVLLAIIFPPLAVVDRGCGSVLIVFLLTLCGWVPGVIAALIILNKNEY